MTEPGSGRTTGAGEIVETERYLVQPAFILGLRLELAQWPTFCPIRNRYGPQGFSLESGRVSIYFVGSFLAH
jgi:hypothetical protein